MASYDDCVTIDNCSTASKPECTISRLIRIIHNAGVNIFSYGDNSVLDSERYVIAF